MVVYRVRVQDRAIIMSVSQKRGEVGGHVFIVNSSVLGVHCDAFLCPGFNGYNVRERGPGVDWRWSPCGNEPDPTADVK